MCILLDMDENSDHFLGLSDLTGRSDDRSAELQECWICRCRNESENHVKVACYILHDHLLVAHEIMSQETPQSSFNLRC